MTTPPGPIIILEDDYDDQEILKDVFESLNIPNELMIFDTGSAVLNYLRTTPDRPFLIITDINLPGMSGIELRATIMKDEYLKKKSIPYIFLSTSDDKSAVTKAYEMQVQGYFQKESTFEGIQRMIKMIVDYWKLCLHPNSFASKVPV